jgi:hypothetical protein
MMRLIFLLLVFFAANPSAAQDTIRLKSGDVIPAVVLEITDEEIRFKRFDAPKGPTLTFYTMDVESIRYENGMESILNEVNVQHTEANAANNAARGREDARKYYRGKKSGHAAIGTTTILLSPVIGIVPAVICASTKPKDKNLMYPNKELMKSEAYKQAYVKQAKKIKQRVIWTTYGVSTAAFFILVLLL